MGFEWTVLETFAYEFKLSRHFRDSHAEGRVLRIEKLHPRLLTYIAFRSYASPMIFCNYCLHIRNATTRCSTPANLLDRTCSYIANLTTQGPIEIHIMKRSF
jgi:hypothetical protein